MKHSWYIIVPLIFVAPLLLNYFLLWHSPIDIVGDSEIWLSFWGAYLTSLVTLLVLFSTLKQQMVLSNVGLNERKIQTLLKNFKENFDFIRYMDVHRNIELIKNHEYKESQLFFYNEIQKCLTKQSTIFLDFNNNETIEYRYIFLKQCKAYANLINHAIRVEKFSSIETLGRKISYFKECEGNGKSFFSTEEYEEIVKSKSEEEFISTLIKTLDRCFESFGKTTYPTTQKELIEISNKIIERLTKELCK